MRKDLKIQHSPAMEEYLEEYGYHFNRSLCDYAVGMMSDRNGNPLKGWDKSKTEEFLRNNSVVVKRNLGHDAVYVLNMARADYWGSSINTEQDLAKFVKDYLDDGDGSDSKAFDHFYIDCVAKGVPVFWDEML